MESGSAVIAAVFIAYLIDNMLLTIVVPILPVVLSGDYDMSLEIAKNSTSSNSISKLSAARHPPVTSDSAVGLLFAVKPITQLICNPIVGHLVQSYSNTRLLLSGTATSFVSCALFASSRHYGLMLLARAIHGISSALSLISGMTILAAHFQDYDDRSRVMGIALSGMAVGVLIGYPFGGIMLEWTNESLPFIVLAASISGLGACQICLLRNKTQLLDSVQHHGSYMNLLCDQLILTVVGSIGVSTTAIALLEPCEPLWLVKTIKPEVWQIGFAFIPDSVGYLIGTSCLSRIVYKFDRFKCVAISLLTVGTALFIIPYAKSMWHLVLPHFGIGLGIATIDVCFMPFLADYVDQTEKGGYGTVYALTQTTVGTSYFLGPASGGWLMDKLGFKWTLRGLSLANIVYSAVPLWKSRNVINITELRGIIPDGADSQERRCVLSKQSESIEDATNNQCNSYTELE